MNTKKVAALGAGALLVATGLAAPTVTAAGAERGTMSRYSNCTELNRDFKHGVSDRRMTKRQWIRKGATAQGRLQAQALPCCEVVHGPRQGPHRLREVRARVLRRPGLMAAVSGLVLASTILAGCAKQSSLTIALSDDRVGVGDEVVVRGALTESSPGVPISVESREAGTDDAFVAVGASTATDESGSYVLRFQLSKTGTFEIQTVAAPPEGDEVASQASELTVLTPTAVRITQGPEREIDAAEIVVIKGIVRPAKERRTVVLQESTGGVGWRETGVKDKTDSQGRFRLTVKPRSTGALTWRVFVQESASGAEGASAIVRTQVVDYKTAGAQVLEVHRKLQRCIPSDGCTPIRRHSDRHAPEQGRRGERS